MNQKINWTRRSRVNAGTRDIPVRFSRGAGFEVKIKGSARNRILGSLAEKAFNLNTRVDNISEMSALALLKTRSVLALVTLPESMLDGRRTTRKKRC